MWQLAAQKGLMSDMDRRARSWSTFAEGTQPDVL